MKSLITAKAAAVATGMCVCTGVITHQVDQYGLFKGPQKEVHKVVKHHKPKIKNFSEKTETLVNCIPVNYVPIPPISFGPDDYWNFPITPTEEYPTTGEEIIPPTNGVSEISTLPLAATGLLMLSWFYRKNK